MYIHHYCSFIEKLDRYGVCSQEPGGFCQVESVDVTCSDEFSFGFRRKKRQAQRDTLTFRFNFTISVGSECNEVNCQEKHERLVQVTNMGLIEFATIFKNQLMSAMYFHIL